MPEIMLNTIENLRIAECIIGEGEPLVMLHGWGAEIKLLSPLAERLAPKGYRVYMLDLPAFGQSATPDRAWSVQDYARFVLAYLDAHQLQRVGLFGHSFGGRISLVLGAEHPERLTKIVLSNSAGIRNTTSSTNDYRLRVYKSIRDGLYRVGAKGLADSLRQWYNQRYGSADFNQASGIVRDIFVKVVNEDLRGYAARVAVPTLLFWGDADQDTPLWQGELLEKTIPDAGLVIYKGGGHYVYLEQAANVAQTMDYFFRHS